MPVGEPSAVAPRERPLAGRARRSESLVESVAEGKDGVEASHREDLADRFCASDGWRIIQVEALAGGNQDAETGRVYEAAPRKIDDEALDALLIETVQSLVQPSRRVQVDLTHGADDGDLGARQARLDEESRLIVRLHGLKGYATAGRLCTPAPLTNAAR